MDGIGMGGTGGSGGTGYILIDLSPGVVKVGGQTYSAWKSGLRGGLLGGFVLSSLGTNVATVARVLFKGLVIATADLPATTASAKVKEPPIWLPVSLPVPPETEVYLMLVDTVAAGWVPHAVAEQY